MRQRRRRRRRRRCCLADAMALPAAAGPHRLRRAAPSRPPPSDAHPARQRMMDLMYSLTIDMVMSDTESLLAFADEDEAAAAGPIGTVGYCMSGQFAINAAARFPERVNAAASIYGTFLVTDEKTSPH